MVHLQQATGGLLVTSAPCIGHLLTRAENQSALQQLYACVSLT